MESVQLIQHKEAHRNRVAADLAADILAIAARVRSHVRAPLRRPITVGSVVKTGCQPGAATLRSPISNPR
jgi:hypothetical protein